MLIETTGLADPLPIIRLFVASEEVAEAYHLDGVVTVVDAKHVLKRLEDKSETGDPGEAVQQIAYADRIVLNKTDLVEEKELEEVLARIGGINALASVQPAKRSVVPVDYVLGVGGFDLAKVGEQVGWILRRGWGRTAVGCLALLCPNVQPTLAATPPPNFVS